MPETIHEAAAAPAAGERLTCADHVRRATDPAVNRRLDARAAARLQRYAAEPAGAIERRLLELEREWDVERWLEANASLLAFGAIALAGLRRRSWLVLGGLVTGFLFQHAVQGWCPPLPLLRRLGVRTRQEIDAELYALKALRGDFANVPAASTDPAARARAALAALAGPA